MLTDVGSLRSSTKTRTGLDMGLQRHRLSGHIHCPHQGCSDTLSPNPARFNQQSKEELERMISGLDLRLSLDV